jgi:hypothetical protein
MTKKLTFRSLAVAGTISACVGLVVSATPAEAATYFTLIGTRSSWTYQCIPGMQYGVLPTNIGGVNHVNNGCSGRIYLYHYKGGSGWSYCISPHAAYASVPYSRSNGYGAAESTSTKAC